MKNRILRVFCMLLIYTNTFSQTGSYDRLLLNGVADDGNTPLQINNELRLSGYRGALLFGEPFVADGTIRRWVLQRRDDGYFGGGNRSLVLWADKSNGYYAPMVFSDNGNITLASGLNAISGNVGIGTSEPGAKLHIALPSTTNPITKQSDLNGYLQLSDYNSPIEAKTGIVASFQAAPGIASGVIFGRYGSTWGTYIGFHTHSDNANTLDDLNEKMRIDGNGNVGIGTTQPDSKLTVKGKIHAEEVKVDLNVPGPDYVFERDYDLKSLPEVERFIVENKHLPEIPSAKAIKENGINVGDMQMKLLQKVEELTLHLIEQNKKMEEQSRKFEQRMAEQQREINKLKSKK